MRIPTISSYKVSLSRLGLLISAGTCLFMLVASTSAQEIPTGVNYKKASDAVNQKAKTVLETALTAQPEALNLDATFDAGVVCGPLLWDVLKEYVSDELRHANPTTVLIGGPKPLRKDAKRVITPEQKREFWKLFIAKIKQNNSFIVRKAIAAEIQYYWATIPFDIEEPFYIVDFGKQKVLMHFRVKDNEPRVFWMDIVGDLATLSSTSQSSDESAKHIVPPPEPRVSEDTNAPEGWKRYQFAYNGGDTLSVFMPAEPEESAGKGQVATDVTITMMTRNFSVSTKLGSYNAFYADSLSIPADRMTEKQKTMFYDALPASFAKGAVAAFKKAGQQVEVKTLDRKTITVSGREGLEQSFSVGPLQGRARVVVAGPYAYAVLALWTPEAPEAQTVSFFDSFEIRKN